jgi:FAD/FMN-containing dehydrogenase
MAWLPREKADRQLAVLRAALDRLPDGYFGNLGLSPDDLEALQECMEGRVVVPGDPEYEGLRWKGSHYPDLDEPGFIAMCEVVSDVRCCLDFARRHDVEFAPRSGGHSTVGFGVPRGMVVDLSELHGVLMSDDLRSVRVQAGANLSKVYRTLEVYDRHIPGGECDSVGVAGHMQGGGYGFTSREFGLNCDVVEEVSMMLADGSIVRANVDTNSLLYWAVRGGTGNNFGVLLEVRYRLAELKELWGGTFLWTIDKAPELLAALQAGYMREGDVPSRLGFQLAMAFFPVMGGEKVPVLVMMCMFNGSEPEALDLLQPLFGIHEPVEVPFSKVERYFDLNRDLIDSFYPDPPPRKGTYELKSSAYVAAPLGTVGWGEVVDVFKTSPNPYNVIAMEVYGGRISEVQPEDTAFVHRHTDGDLFWDSFYNDDWAYNDREAAQKWLDDVADVIGKYSTGGRYQNYPERGLEDFMTAYFGDNARKLVDAKKAYDPDDFFTFEQGIKPG